MSLLHFYFWRRDTMTKAYYSRKSLLGACLKFWRVRDHDSQQEAWKQANTPGI